MVHETNYQDIDMNYLDPMPENDHPVLLLHGLGADGESWYYQIQALIESGLRPIVPDLPGFGASPAPRYRWTIRSVAKELADLLSNLTNAPVDVVGISLGGAIAQQLALDTPEKVRNLVLVNTFACLRPERANEWVYLLRRFAIASLRGANAQAQAVAWRIFPGAGQADLRQILVDKIQHADPKVYRSAMRSLALFDVRRKLKNIRMPVLVITSQNDTTVPLVNQAVLVRGISGAVQILIPDANHAVIADQPDLLNQALLSFLCQ
jgi:3-oxoadipate enol-lactonase